jgi:hypothetical protein
MAWDGENDGGGGDDDDDDDKHERQDQAWTSVDEDAKQRATKKRLVESGCRGDCEAGMAQAQAQAGNQEPPAMRSSDGKEPPLFDESSQYWEDSKKNNVHGT